MLGQCPACAPPEAAATTRDGTDNDYDDDHGEGGKGPFQAGHLQRTPVTCADSNPTQPNPASPDDGGDPDPVERFFEPNSEGDREREREQRETHKTSMAYIISLNYLLVLDKRQQQQQQH